MNAPPAKTFVRIVGLLVLVALINVGCAGSGGRKTSKPVPWTISITKVTPASIEADLIGLSKSEESYWRNIKPDDYWAPNSRIKREVASRIKSTRFEDSSKFTLTSEDPIWKKWLSEGAVELMVIASLPVHDNTPSDPRRVFLPLGKKEWEARKQTVELEISEGLVRVLTPQKP